MSVWSGILIAVLVIVVVLAVVAGWWMARRYRSARLRERFGPDYDRIIELTPKAWRLRSDPDDLADIDNDRQRRRAHDHA